MHANIYTVIALHKIQTNTIFLTLKFHDADLIAASLFFCFFFQFPAFARRTTGMVFSGTRTAGEKLLHGTETEFPHRSLRSHI